jgi:hypothetical protein
MDRETVRQVQAVEEILTFDIPDDALERTASIEPNALTWIPCTHLPYDCGWPLGSAPVPAADPQRLIFDAAALVGADCSSAVPGKSMCSR